MAPILIAVKTLNASHQSMERKIVTVDVVIGESFNLNAKFELVKTSDE